MPAGQPVLRTATFGKRRLGCRHTTCLTAGRTSNITQSATKKARVATIVAKKMTWRSKKKKSTAEDLLKLDDISESEVDLDPHGQFFNNLIDTDYCQETRGPAMP